MSSGEENDTITLPLVTFVMGVIAMAVAFTCFGPRAGDAPEAFARGRCVGWADAAGLVPAWDDEGRCVLGQYPADSEAPAEAVVRLEAEVVP